ncbi:MAG: hypothetical protein JSU01_17305 [Bacteroidetes bacterium]|nr:hypothetical protein [Bacteroidota bacterium]
MNRNENISVFAPIFKGYNKLMILFWGILPALGLFGYWDRFLSSDLFSGNFPEMVICVGDVNACKPLEPFCYNKDTPNTCHGLRILDIQRLTLMQTGVSAYPEVRTYKIIQEKLERRYPLAGLNFVYIIK